MFPHRIVFGKLKFCLQPFKVAFRAKFSENQGDESMSALWE